jgi:hypothetical protein
MRRFRFARQKPSHAGFGEMGNFALLQSSIIARGAVNFLNNSMVAREISVHSQVPHCNQ